MSNHESRGKPKLELLLKETCRLHARATYAVLVDAMTSFFQGRHPNLSWITEAVSTSPHPL